MKISMKLNKKWICPVLCFATAMLVFLREVNGVSVNKYIFALIALVGLALMDAEDSIAFFYFMIPLFSGLPGNYIRLIYLIGLFVKLQKKKLNMVVSLLAAGCLTLEILHMKSLSNAQNYMFWTINLLLFTFIATRKREQTNPDKSIVLYSTATAIAGAIMLICTVKMGFLEKVLIGRYRFGDFSDFASDSYNEAMHLSMDPNYLGFYMLTAIIGVYVLVRNKRIAKIPGVLLISINALWGFITLSRTFVILLVLFVLCTLFESDSNISKKLMLIIELALFAVIILWLLQTFYPETIEAVVQRFNASDMAGGNGRMDLISIYLDKWFEHPIYMLFGTGFISMMDNLGMGQNLHCTQMEVIVGAGLLGTMMWIAFGCVIIMYVKKYCLVGNKIGFYAKVIFIIQFVAVATLPTMLNIAQLDPLLMSSMIALAEDKTEGRIY